MANSHYIRFVGALSKIVHPLNEVPQDYDPLLDLIGDARLVLLGEATHGTHEFYRDRAEITKRLIREKGFTAVAIEADWPDTYRVNRFVRHMGSDAASFEALSGFKKFPAWMWRNIDVLSFVSWLRDYNGNLLPHAPKVGFYGLDLYSLYSSIEAVIAYLEKVDPEAARRAHYRYSCFEHFGEDPQAYGYSASFGITESCEKAVVEQLVDLHQHAQEYAHRDGRLAEDDLFYAEQNARLAKNAEEYYRTLFRGNIASWNLRDKHMVETLGTLADYLEKDRKPAKIVVWAHNSHVGDARATEVGEGGEMNVGQLVREKYDQDAVLVGFTTYSGTVSAASNWGSPAERKHVRPALPGSYEALFHDIGIPNFLLLMRDKDGIIAHLNEPMMERAIGVVYHPHTERISHYFYAKLPQQFDAVIHLNRTHAVEPLDRTSVWEAGELPETYPSGL